MILDAQNRFSNAQALTAIGAVLSTNVLDLGDQHALITSNGAPDIEIYLAAVTTFTSAGAATLSVEVLTDDNTAMSSPTVHEVSPTFALAELAAGSRLRWQPRVPITTQRYLALRYTVAVAAFTAGAITAVVTLDRQTNR